MKRLLLLTVFIAIGAIISHVHATSVGGLYKVYVNTPSNTTLGIGSTVQFDCQYADYNSQNYANYVELEIVGKNPGAAEFRGKGRIASLSYGTVTLDIKNIGEITIRARAYKKNGGPTGYVNIATYKITSNTINYQIVTNGSTSLSDSSDKTYELYQEWAIEKVTWSVSNASVAKIVSQNNKKVVLSAIKNGTVTLKAEILLTNGQTKTATLSIGATINPLKDAIVIVEGPNAIQVNQVAKYKLKGYPAGTKITWTTRVAYIVDFEMPEPSAPIVSGQGTDELTVKGVVTRSAFIGFILEYQGFKKEEHYGKYIEITPATKSLKSHSVPEVPFESTPLYSVKVYSFQSTKPVYQEKNIECFDIFNTMLPKGYYIIEKTDSNGNITRDKIYKRN